MDGTTRGATRGELGAPLGELEAPLGQTVLGTRVINSITYWDLVVKSSIYDDLES